MSSQFSENDFTVFQNQLLTLRESNCQLDDKFKKQEKELILSRERISNLEKDLLKANQIIAKSKMLKSIENLMNEIYVLQAKLQTQEDDFRFQNQELMHQLSALMTTNESLEHKLSQTYLVKSDSPITNDESSLSQEHELRRLQAENLVLQASLNTYLEENKMTQHLDINSKINSDNTNDGASVNLSDSKSNNDFQLKFNTELAEKELIKNQLTLLQSSKSSLESELLSFKEKLKKKQESMLQLQNDKDHMYEKMSKELEDNKLSNASDINKLNLEISVLKTKLQEFQSIHQNLITSSNQTISQLEQRIIDSEIKVNNENLLANVELSDLVQKAEIMKLEQEDLIRQLTSTNSDLCSKIKELESSLDVMKEQNYDLQRERDKQISSLQNMTLIADSRKTALDKLAVDHQEKMDAFQTKLNQVTKNFEEKILPMEQERDILKLSVSDLRSVETANNFLKNQIQFLENSRSEIEERLNVATLNLEKAHKAHSLDSENAKTTHEFEIFQIKELHSNEIETLQKQIIERDETIESLRNEIIKLNQDVVDQIEEKKNHEKKGAINLKDLKRQVQSEMKRANKLQEKLQEILGDTRGRSSVDELFRPYDGKDSLKNADTSSLSSWSPSGHSRDNNNQSSEDDSQNMLLRRENEALIRRIADLQLKISTFEEKVNLLEESNSLMADDLIAKKSVIDHYIMENRAGQPIGANDKLTLKRLFDFVIEKSDDNTKEINKKLQNVLEETLTRNMHLQNDLDIMAKQLSERSK